MLQEHNKLQEEQTFELTHFLNFTMVHNTPPNCSMPEQDSESFTKYSKDPDPGHDLAELQEHFKQLQEWLDKLEPTANPHAHAKELVQLTGKVQQLTVTLQLTSNPQTYGRLFACGYAEIHRYLMYHTVTNKPHHIFTSRHLHIWWVRLHKAGRLAQWSWVGHWYSKGQSSMPSQG